MKKFLKKCKDKTIEIKLNGVPVPVILNSMNLWEEHSEGSDTISLWGLACCGGVFKQWKYFNVRLPKISESGDKKSFQELIAIARTKLERAYNNDNEKYKDKYVSTSNIHLKC